MNRISGTLNVAPVVTQSVIDAGVTQVWDRVEALHSRIIDLQIRLTPVSTPSPEIKGPACAGSSEPAEEQSSPLSTTFKQLGISLSAANARMDEIIHHLEL